MRETLIQHREKQRQSHDRLAHQALPPLSPPSPNRFAWRIIAAIIVEALVILMLLLTLSLDQFSFFEYFLGLLGLVAILILLARSFWLASHDEAQLHWKMREWEEAWEKEKPRSPPLAA